MTLLARCKRQGDRLMRRYGWPELVATLLALGAASLAFAITSDLAVMAVAGAVGEDVGFYGFVIVRAGREAWCQQPSRWGRLALRVVGSLVREYVVAEGADMLLRPILMYWGQVAVLWLAGPDWLLAGLVAGKLAADLVFYALALASYTLRQRQIDRLHALGE